MIPVKPDIPPPAKLGIKPVNIPTAAPAPGPDNKAADKIAILHGGKIIALDTLEGLKKLFPSAKVEYIEKQPTLEEIFLTIVGKKGEK